MTDIVDVIDARIRAALEHPQVIDALVVAIDDRSSSRDLGRDVIRFGEVTTVEPDAFTARVRLMEDGVAIPGFRWGEVLPFVDDLVMVRMTADGADKSILRILGRRGDLLPVDQAGLIVIVAPDGSLTTLEAPPPETVTDQRLRWNATTFMLEWVDDV